MLKQDIGNGKNKITVSKIALGSCFVGTEIDKATSEALLDEYFAAGGNFIDTARVYAMWLPNGDGASEKLIGSYLEKKRLREKTVISTKGGHPPLDDMKKSRLDKGNLHNDLSESLEFLKTSYTDIYFLHRDDENIPVSEIMPTLHEFILSGKVRLLGASNWSTKRIAQANQFAIEKGLTPFSVSQIQWSLAKTTPEQIGDPTIVCMNDDEYKWYRENKFPVMAFSPQSKGFFSKALAVGIEDLNEKIKQRFITDENMEKLKIVKQISENEGVSPAAVALSYITNNAVNGIAIIGSSNLAQLKDSLGASDFVLNKSDKEKIGCF